MMWVNLSHCPSVSDFLSVDSSIDRVNDRFTESHGLFSLLGIIKVSGIAPSCATIIAPNTRGIFGSIADLVKQ